MTTAPAGRVPTHVQGLGPMLGRVAAVTGNTLREAGRNRIFYGLLVVAGVMILGSMVL